MTTVRIVFSRKGFDQSSGGAPSPIIDGVPVSLPIPAADRSETTYRQLGLGDTVETATRGRIHRDHLCHHDPVFTGCRCAFGQTGAAQTHLANQGVGVGDVFLFFGLFAHEGKTDKHHRIFGYLKVDEILHCGADPDMRRIRGFKRRHPHTIGAWHANNTIYLGEGRTAGRAPNALRLTAKDEPPSIWRIPPWLRKTGLSYHADPGRWLDGNRLRAASRGQEFVADAGNLATPRRWLEHTLGEIAG